MHEFHYVPFFKSFDELPMRVLNSEAVDFRAASECFEPARRLKRRDLETLRLITTVHGKSCPTIGGILLFGRDRLRYFPDAWIQAGRFAGKDRSRIQDHAELTGLLPSAISEQMIESRPSFFASSEALLKAEGRSSSGAILERSDQRFAPFAPLREKRIFVLFVKRSQGFQFVLEIAIIQMIGNGCGGCRVLREFL